MILFQLVSFSYFSKISSSVSFRAFLIKPECVYQYKKLFFALLAGMIFHCTVTCNHSRKIMLKNIWHQRNSNTRPLGLMSSVLSTRLCWITTKKLENSWLLCLRVHDILALGLFEQLTICRDKKNFKNGTFFTKIWHRSWFGRVCQYKRRAPQILKCTRERC